MVLVFGIKLCIFINYVIEYVPSFGKEIINHYFIRNPQTTIALTFLTHNISDIGGVFNYLNLLNRNVSRHVYYFRENTLAYKIDIVLVTHLLISSKFSSMLI